MADLDNNLSLADALTEPPPEIEPEIKRDFIATLEAEKFDDVVGETVGKTDYVPLLDDDDDDDAKAGNQDQKSKSHTEGVQVQRSSASGPAAVLENGDHGIGDYNTVPHGGIMDEKLSHKEFMDHKETWAMDERDLCFEPQAVFKPMEATEPGLMYREVDLSDLIIPSETQNFPPLAEHVEASKEVHAPYAAMVGSEQPSSKGPYFAAEALDSSVFPMDSAAEYLQERAAPARDRVPEEPWFGSHYAEETPEASFFEPAAPIRVPEAAEQCLPESSIADAPFLVAEPTEETKTTAAPQEATPADPAASVPVADAGSVPAFAADSWAAPAVDAGTAPALDPWSAGSAPPADLWSLPPANVASAPTMDSWAVPAAGPWVAPSVPVPAADAGSSPAACVPTTEAGAVSAMEELLTFDHSIEQQGPALHMPPAESSAPFVIKEQEVPVSEVSVPGAEHIPVLAKLEDKIPSPSQHLPEPVTCVPEPAAEAKEPLTIAEAKETLPEKSAPLGDFTPVEKPKEEPENGHVQHLEPVHDKPPQEPTAKPEEIKSVETVTGSDITAPPNKELPPSPEKKTKPSASTPSTKPAAEKARPLSATSPKRPASTTPGQNKKSTSPTTGPAAATPKRPATGTPRPSTLTAKDTKPKVAEAKSTEKRTSLSKPASATTPRTSVKSTPAAPRTTAASPVTTTSSMKNTSVSPPKRPTSIKTETKPADAKKTPVKSPSADLSRPRSAPGNSLKSSTTTSTATTPTTTMTSPGVATSRPKPKPAATRPATASSANADAKKPLAAKAPLKTSTTSKPSRPTSSVSAPDLKNVRSKIGSTDNIKHQPGGGKGKVEKKPESAGAARKPESNAVSKMATTKTTVTKESAQKQPNGKVQIVSKKANYSHVQSKCGSKDNIKHVPGGGNVQIQTKKVDLSKVSSKCGSKTTIKHKPGGGDIKIENQKLNSKEKAQAKAGSVDSAGQTPTEGPAKAEESKEAAPPALAPLDGAAAVPPAGGNTQENGVGPAVPAAAGGGDQRDSQSFDTQIQETN